MGVETPRVGLLNNGTEEEKGNELTKETHQLLKSAPIHFAGNCEARDVLGGEFDVVVCDGFDGNVVLKGTEGTVSLMLGMLKKGLNSTFFTKIGALLCKPAFRMLKKKLDYTEYARRAAARRQRRRDQGAWQLERQSVPLRDSAGRAACRIRCNAGA